MEKRYPNSGSSDEIIIDKIYQKATNGEKPNINNEIYFLHISSIDPNRLNIDFFDKNQNEMLLFSMGSEIRLTQNFVDFIPLEPLRIPLGRGRAAYKILLEGSNHRDAE